MTLAEFIKNEERLRLEATWRRLTRWQKTALLLRALSIALPRLGLRWRMRFIEDIRARFESPEAAHWVGKG